MRYAFRGLLAVVAAFVLFAQARSAEGPKHSPSVSPRVLALAKEWFYRFQSANIDRRQLVDSINQHLSSQMIRDEASKLKALGHPISFAFVGSERVLYATGYDFLVTFPSAKIVESIALDSNGKIAGIDFRTFVPE